eukprot:8710875-Alexandrium_andersonii.AAC.1
MCIRDSLPSSCQIYRRYSERRGVVFVRAAPRPARHTQSFRAPRAHSGEGRGRGGQLSCSATRKLRKQSPWVRRMKPTLAVFQGPCHHVHAQREQVCRMSPSGGPGGAISRRPYCAEGKAPGASPGGGC